MSRRAAPTLLVLALAMRSVAACEPVDVPGDDAGDTTDASTDVDAGDDGDAGAPDAGEVDAGPVDGGGTAAVVPETLGEWTASGSRVDIDGAHWGTRTVVALSNEDRTVYVREPPTAGPRAYTFGRMRWTRPDDHGAFHACLETAAHVTLDDAIADTTTADATAPGTGGCNGAPWTAYTPVAPETSGEWTTDEGLVTIGAEWEGVPVRAVSNTENWAVLAVPADASSQPGTFQRLTWTDVDIDGTFWTCLLQRNAHDVLTVLDTDRTADASSPATGGCAGAPWRRYQRRASNTHLAMNGTWIDGFGDTLIFTDTTFEIVDFGTEQILHFDNATRRFVTQSGADPNVWPAPNTFSRHHFIPGTDEAWLCTITSAQPNVSCADGTPTDATTCLPGYDRRPDARQPSIGGCNGEPWTRLTPP